MSSRNMSLVPFQVIVCDIMYHFYNPTGMFIQDDKTIVFVSTPVTQDNSLAKTRVV